MTVVIESAATKTNGTFFPIFIWFVAIAIKTAIIIVTPTIITLLKNCK